METVDAKLNSGVDISPSTRIGFHNLDESIPGIDGHTVGDFWRWAYSDVLSNGNRSVFAEYIVGVALGVVSSEPRVEWNSVDLSYQTFKVEVKSSAYLQSWVHKKPSTIRFSISKAVFWNRETGAYEGEATHSANIYVFCLYPERDETKANVLDVAAWEFYVVPTEILNGQFGKAKSISLESVKRVAVLCKFEGLRAAVNHVLPKTASTTTLKLHE